MDIFACRYLQAANQNQPLGVFFLFFYKFFVIRLTGGKDFYEMKGMRLLLRNEN
jgi:hypothetical protein